MNLRLKVNPEGTEIKIIDNKENPQPINSFYIEITKEKIEKISTPRFLAECFLGRRLKKNEAVFFKDGNELNFTLDNLSIVSLSMEKNISYTAISLDEKEERLEYKSISSVSRALGIRGVIIKGCIEGLIDKVRSPKTNKYYRFEKHIVE